MTKVLSVYFITVLAPAHLAFAQDLTTVWQTETINQINREPMHASYFVIESKAAVLQKDRQKL